MIALGVGAVVRERLVGGCIEGREACVGFGARQAVADLAFGQVPKSAQAVPTSVSDPPPTSAVQCGNSAATCAILAHWMRYWISRSESFKPGGPARLHELLGAGPGSAGCSWARTLRGDGRPRGLNVVHDQAEAGRLAVVERQRGGVAGPFVPCGV